VDNCDFYNRDGWPSCYPVNSLKEMNRTQSNNSGHRKSSFVDPPSDVEKRHVASFIMAASTL